MWRLNQADVLATLGENPQNPDQIKKITTAIHETGHLMAFLALHSDEDFTCTIKATGMGLQGQMKSARNTVTDAHNLEQLWAELTILLAGQHAEFQCLGFMNGEGLRLDDLAFSEFARQFYIAKSKAGQPELLFTFEPNTPEEITRNISKLDEMHRNIWLNLNYYMGTLKHEFLQLLKLIFDRETITQNHIPDDLKRRIWKRGQEYLVYNAFLKDIDDE